MTFSIGQKVRTPIGRIATIVEANPECTRIATPQINSPQWGMTNDG